jgi:SAM-dependent methyltransferase
MRGFRVQKEQYILQQVRAGARILHVGCTNAPTTAVRWHKETLLHKDLCDEAKSCGAHIVGLDIDKASLAWLQERMPDAELYFGDAQKILDCVGLGNRFDLILATDVIEHLSNPGLFLESCRALLSRSGHLLITTCNAFGIGRFAKALLNHEAVHEEHTAYFSHRNLTRLCLMCGLTALKLGYYECEPMKQFSLNVLVTNLLERIMCVPYPQFSEGIIVEAEALPESEGTVSGKWLSAEEVPARSCATSSIAASGKRSSSNTSPGLTRKRIFSLEQT